MKSKEEINFIIGNIIAVTCILIPFIFFLTDIILSLLVGPNALRKILFNY